MNSYTAPLFDTAFDSQPPEQKLCEGAMLLRGFALAHERAILHALDDVLHASPLRHMHTPGGLRMSVAMSNCGALGWVSDRRGYRYSPDDPESGEPWPAMPQVFALLARDAASEAGFQNFSPDACLINRYEPDAKLSLHQDRNERDFDQPIVSLSLGLPAVFLFGGLRRNDKQMRVPLAHGDVVVWGGASRMRYHGVLPLKDGAHPVLGACRINLTFRKAR
ncbi:MAG TPA: DNA oxidative demethylase AlkB [Rhodanobacteraceae bacterium]|nr:DNA oxidative demethylase AlkB [Rhodanobacteraceae bacterium]